MERREPDYEDERIRYWEAPRNTEDSRDADPTVLDVDLSTEDVFESRVYQVRPETLVDITVEAILANPDVPMEEFAAMLLAGADDAAFRMMAKERKSDGLLTYIAVGQFAGSRYLLTREDLVDEERYRAFVAEFEADALARGVVGPPTVVDREQWRQYGDDARTRRPPSQDRP